MHLELNKNLRGQAPSTQKVDAVCPMLREKTLNLKGCLALRRWTASIVYLG